MKNKLIYPFCIGGMVFLVLVALFFPQIIFSIQDMYRMENTETEVRSNLNVSGLDLSYEQNMNARLYNFLNMQDMTVTAIEYEFADDSELQELLEKILKQDWFAMPYDMNMMTTYLLTVDFWEKFPVSVRDCKKYLVHGRDYQDGVALMMWYLDLYLEPVDTRVRILADTETDTIYYVKITEGLNEEVEEYKVDKSLSERLYYWADIAPEFFYFYYSYYEADEAMLHSEYGTYDINRPWFVETKMVEYEYCEITFPLCYGELNADFQMRAELGKGIYPNLTMGLPVIGEMIPEMIQD